MANVTKIYELRTLGYDKISKELSDIQKKFEEIRKTKNELNKVKASTEDSAEIRKATEEYERQRLITKGLEIEKQKLINAAKAEQVLRQAEINQQKAAAAGAKATGDAMKFEAGSVKDLRLQIRELNQALIGVNKNSGSLVSFKGQLLTYDQAIAKFKQLTAAEQAFRRQFAADKTLVGEYTTGIIQAFKSMGLEDLVGAQAQAAADKVKLLNAEFDRLRDELRATKAAGGAGMDELEQDLIENRKEAERLKQEVSRLNTELRGSGDIGNQITNGIGRGFREAGTQLRNFVIGYVGLQAAFQGLTQGVAITKELADQTTSLEIELGKTAGGADDLVGSLQKLDTRTKLTGLLDIANIATRAGTAEKNLLAVTEAVDKTKVAFGKDFGDVETGTETFVKLINIFYEDGEITGDRILKIGNGIRTLANETVASVPFITDFSGRMAGLRQVANISLGDVIGLGAGFEEFKQSAEVASTALVKVIPKIGKDVEKFAQITGLTTDQYRELVNNNPAEALIKVSEALVAGKGDIEQVSAALGDAELGAGRVTTILATLGGKADVFRERISRAGVAVKETSNINDAFAAKNTNLAGTLDKLTKKLADAANAKGFQLVVGAIAGSILILINVLPTLLVLLGLMATAYAVNNFQLLLLRGQMLLYNAGLITARIVQAGLAIATLAYNAVLGLLTGVTTGATVATRLFSLALRALPFGLILTVLGVLVATFKAFGSTIKGTTAELRRYAIQKQLLEDISKRVVEATTDEITKIQNLTSVIRDNATSHDVKKRALQELIALNPQYLSGLNEANILTAEGTRILNTYIDSLKSKAAYEAASEIQKDKIKEDLKLLAIENKLTNRINSGKGTELEDLTDEEKEYIGNARKNFAFTASVADALLGSSAADEALAAVRAARGEIATEISETDKLVKEKYLGLSKTIASAPGIKPGEGVAGRTVDDIKADLKLAVEQFGKAVKDSPEAKTLKNKIAILRQELIDAGGAKAPGAGRTKVYSGAKLTGEQKDTLREIDAFRDQLLAEAAIARRKNEIEEEEFLRRNLKINTDAIDKKLAYIKGKNAEEKKEIAQLKLERITNEQDTADKIFDIRKTLLDNSLDSNIKEIQAKDKIVQEDPTTGAEKRAQSKLDSDKAILALQIKHGEDIALLEKLLGQQSLKNSKETADAILKTKAEIAKAEIILVEASLTDQKAAGAKNLAEFKAIIAAQRLAIAQSDKSPQKKKIANQALDDVETLGTLAREVADGKAQLPEYKKLYEAKRITQTEYFNFLSALADKEAALANHLSGDIEKASARLSGLGDLIKQKIEALVGFDTSTQAGKDRAALLAETIAQTYAFAAEAMNSFFDQKEARLERDKQHEIEKLDVEFQHRKDRAQGAAEEASLDKQLAEQKEAVERQAFEKNKKIQLAQAKINLGIQLANLAVIAFAPNPLNIATLGTAGAIMYAIQAALALGNYALNTSRIRSATYAQGGEVPSRGGVFRGREHRDGGTPFNFKGSSFEAEVDELAIVRTRNAPRNKVFELKGTHKQIASQLNRLGGGVEFAPGGSIKKFAEGGIIGSSLTAPVFTPGLSTTLIASGNNENVLARLAQTEAAMIRLANEQSGRIDRIRVTQETNSVKTALRKQVIQENIGTF